MLLFSRAIAWFRNRQPLPGRVLNPFASINLLDSTAITRTLIEGHGGVIEVESEVGKGSTFTVRLPTGGGEAA